MFGGVCINCQYYNDTKGYSLYQFGMLYFCLVLDCADLYLVLYIDVMSNKADKKYKVSDSVGDGLTMFDWLNQLDTIIFI